MVSNFQNFTTRIARAQGSRIRRQNRKIITGKNRRHTFLRETARKKRLTQTFWHRLVVFWCSFGAIWDSFGIILALFGIIWYHLILFGTILHYFGTIWHYLAPIASQKHSTVVHVEVAGQLHHACRGPSGPPRGPAARCSYLGSWKVALFVKSRRALAKTASQPARDLRKVGVRCARDEFLQVLGRGGPL